MDTLGRDYLREILKEKGEADTVEDLLRMGFHWSFFLGVRHLHMHLLYPTRGVCYGLHINGMICKHPKNVLLMYTFFYVESITLSRSDISSPKGLLLY